MINLSQGKQSQSSTWLPVGQDYDKQTVRLAHHRYRKRTLIYGPLISIRLLTFPNLSLRYLRQWERFFEIKEFLFWMGSFSVQASFQAKNSAQIWYFRTGLNITIIFMNMKIVIFRPSQKYQFGLNFSPEQRLKKKNDFQPTSFSLMVSVFRLKMI